MPFLNYDEVDEGLKGKLKDPAPGAINNNLQVWKGEYYLFDATDENCNNGWYGHLMETYQEKLKANLPATPAPTGIYHAGADAVSVMFNASAMTMAQEMDSEENIYLAVLPAAISVMAIGATVTYIAIKKLKNKVLAFSIYYDTLLPVNQ